MAQSGQRAAADAAAAQMLNAHILFRQQEGRAGSHCGDHGPLLAGKSQSTGAAGGEFIHPIGRQTINIPIHVAGAHTGEDHTPHVLQGQKIAGKVIAQRAEQAGDLILRPHPQHGEKRAMGIQAHHLGGGAADINSQNDIHGEVIPFSR